MEVFDFYGETGICAVRLESISKDFRKILTERSVQATIVDLIIFREIFGDLGHPIYLVGNRYFARNENRASHFVADICRLFSRPEVAVQNFTLKCGLIFEVQYVFVRHGDVRVSVAFVGYLAP